MQDEMENKITESNVSDRAKIEDKKFEEIMFGVEISNAANYLKSLKVIAEHQELGSIDKIIDWAKNLDNKDSLELIKIIAEHRELSLQHKNESIPLQGNSESVFMKSKTFRNKIK